MLSFRAIEREGESFFFLFEFVEGRSASTLVLIIKKYIRSGIAGKHMSHSWQKGTPI